MPKPKDTAELDLVRRAIGLSHITGCCEWDEKAARRFRVRPSLPGLTPEGVKALLYDFIENQRGQLIQVAERRAEYSDRRFYYKVIVPVAGLRHGLFVEIVLDDDAPELPSVRIVNAHEQTR